MARRRRPGRLIALSGVDGSGKSTQVAALAQDLTEQGFHVRPRWIRPGYSDRVEAARRLMRRCGVLDTPPGPGPQRDALLARPGMGTAWLFVALIDIVIEFGAVARLLRRGSVVIYDRWVIDALIDLELGFPNHRRLRSAAWRVVPRVAVTPDCSYLLLLEADEAADRRLAKGEGETEPSVVATARHLEYALFAASDAGGCTVIDASLPQSEVQQIIAGRTREVGTDV